ncbi:MULTISPECIES: DUF3037 domain-containing protein [unclassified Streptomyces]|nr:MULTISPECIES: DUF3037 domain-containing protein [unclassified Streptomyces]
MSRSTPLRSVHGGITADPAAELDRLKRRYAH